MAKKTVVKTKPRKKRQRASTSRHAGVGVGTLVVERMKISAITPAAYNPRRKLAPGDPAFEDLKRSIDRFGYVHSIVWNRRSKTLVSGEQRLAVLAQLGADVVDVVVVDLPPSAEKTLNLALNKISGEWDPVRLAELLAELRADDTIDVKDTGFSDVEIAAQLAELAEVPPAETKKPGPKCPKCGRPMPV